jgi:mannose-6-phosphate isomerase-like protein (cupin superfamily)
LQGGTVSVFLVGESAMAEQPAEIRPATGWGEALATWFDPEDVRLINHAGNNRALRTFMETDGWSASLAEIEPGDFVFAQFTPPGQAAGNAAENTGFRADLTRLVGDVRAIGAKPVLLTPVSSRGLNDREESARLVREVAEATGAALIDHHASSHWYLEAYGPARSRELFLYLEPGDSPNYPRGARDDSRFSPYGARAMASLVMLEIPRAAPALAKHLLKARGGIRRDDEVARPIDAPHDGGGQATGHWYFADAEHRRFAFRKTVLHPGAAIGYHLHDNDEIYYITEGSGILLFNGIREPVGPGTAIFTRRGDSHGLVNDSDADLAVIVVFGTGESQ